MQVVFKTSKGAQVRMFIVWGHAWGFVLACRHGTLSMYAWGSMPLPTQHPLESPFAALLLSPCCPPAGHPQAGNHGKGPGPQPQLRGVAGGLPAAPVGVDEGRLIRQEVVGRVSHAHTPPLAPPPPWATLPTERPCGGGGGHEGGVAGGGGARDGEEQVGLAAAAASGASCRLLPVSVAMMGPGWPWVAGVGGSATCI